MHVSPESRVEVEAYDTPLNLPLSRFGVQNISSRLLPESRVEVEAYDTPLNLLLSRFGIQNISSRTSAEMKSLGTILKMLLEHGAKFDCYFPWCEPSTFTKAHLR